MNRFLLMTLMLLSGIMLAAKPLTSGQAIKAMESQQGAGALLAGYALKGADLKLAYTLKSADRQPLVYAYNVESVGIKGESGVRGFVIAAADDECFPVLGYADKGVATDSMPLQLRGMMEYYGRQIEWLRSQPRQTAMMPGWDVLLKDTRRYIAPMVKTLWGQFAPYNDMCPEVNGQRSVTGCTATAVAQVMAYFHWPKQAKGTGYAQYGGRRYKLDLNKIRIDYKKMTTIYNQKSTAAQKRAVASLMRAAGFGVDMSYSPTGSSSWVEVSEMVNHFDYKPTARNIRRSSYSDMDWDNMIYESIADGSPVIYCGFAPDGYSGGHAFIIDGYQGLGYFHVNFGWSGSGDGYYRLTALAPRGDSRGLSFNAGQSALTGLKPNK